jgi:uncharacterized protein involved in exopolysaccharide biosynthesis
LKLASQPQTSFTAQVSDLPADEQEVSLLSLGSFALRWRKVVLWMVVAGAAVSVARGALVKRTYLSSATFLTQGTDPSDLSAAASFFGARVPNGVGGSWGPDMYQQVLKSHGVLEPIALDTIVVAEEGNRRAAVMDLLGASGSTPAIRLDRAVTKLGGLITASSIGGVGGVQVNVTTQWPSVSLQIAQRLVKGLNDFNLNTRRSQATAERQFLDEQAQDAQTQLSAAEDRMIQFLKNNRSIGSSPELSFQEDRLRREINLRQQIYTTLLQNRETAKSREVRDTPVITMLEAPRMPIGPVPRALLQRGVMGAVIGAVAGLLLALLLHGMGKARRSNSRDAREFFDLLQASTPRLLRRVWG